MWTWEESYSYSKSSPKLYVMELDCFGDVLKCGYVRPDYRDKFQDELKFKIRKSGGDVRIRAATFLLRINHYFIFF